MVLVIAVSSNAALLGSGLLRDICWNRFLLPWQRRAFTFVSGCNGSALALACKFHLLLAYWFCPLLISRIGREQIGGSRRCTVLQVSELFMVIVIFVLTNAAVGVIVVMASKDLTLRVSGALEFGIEARGNPSCIRLVSPTRSYRLCNCFALSA